MDLIDGKHLAQIHQQRVAEELARLGIRPKVVSILVGNDPASVLYTKIKQQKALEVGIDFTITHFPEDINFGEVNLTILKLNEDPTVNGIMVQLPLPEKFLNGKDTNQLLDTISPQKDIDGLRSDSKFLPAAVKAVLSILEDENIEIKGKFVVVVGATGMVGQPLVRELKKLGALVSPCDNQTKNLSEITKRADVLITAVGQPNLITAEMVKNGVVVIDVGTNKLENGKVVGDVDFESVSKKVSKITPVPGGVGPMTVISLMENVVEAVSS
jgi:methylenetetrahydrofolate dehydrogenase (NADP+) / methenyltetrahydrofolate cyclohydrolase